MMKKVALFVFALGMGGSIAHARLPSCNWNCVVEYKYCVLDAIESVNCEAERDECLGQCNSN